VLPLGIQLEVLDRTAYPHWVFGYGTLLRTKKIFRRVAERDPTGRTVATMKVSRRPLILLPGADGGVAVDPGAEYTLVELHDDESDGGCLEDNVPTTSLAGDDEKLAH
jgi:hypothetical protein